MEAEQGSPFESDDVELDNEIEDEGEIDEQELDEEELDEQIDEDEDEEVEDDDSEFDGITDEDIEAALDELEEPEDDEVKTVPHAALHKERMKRKELQAQAGEFQAKEQQLTSEIEQYKETLSDIKKQLKEFGMEDSIDFKAPEDVSPEVLAVRQEKAQRQAEEQMQSVINDISTEAADYLPEYPMIDGNSKEQAELIIGLSLSAHMLGADKEESIEHAMKLVSGILAEKKKTALRGKSRKRVVGTKKTAKAKPRTQREFFDNLAESLS